MSKSNWKAKANFKIASFIAVGVIQLHGKPNYFTLMFILKILIVFSQKSTVYYYKTIKRVRNILFKKNVTVMSFKGIRKCTRISKCVIILDCIRTKHNFLKIFITYK